MLLPGRYSLGTIAPITVAVSDRVLTSGFDAAGAAVAYIDRHEGMNTVTIEVDFGYGPGTATGILLVQTRVGATNRAEEHTSEHQSLMPLSNAALCFKNNK